MSLAMANQHPLTPPLHDHPLLQQVGHRLMHPNAGGAQYQQGYHFDEQYVPSNSTAAYNALQPGLRRVDEYGNEYEQNELDFWDQYVRQTDSVARLDTTIMY